MIPLIHHAHVPGQAEGQEGQGASVNMYCCTNESAHPQSTHACAGAQMKRYRHRTLPNQGGLLVSTAEGWCSAGPSWLEAPPSGPHMTRLSDRPSSRECTWAAGVARHTLAGARLMYGPRLRYGSTAWLSKGDGCAASGATGDDPEPAARRSGPPLPPSKEFPLAAAAAAAATAPVPPRVPPLGRSPRRAAMAAAMRSSARCACCGYSGRPCASQCTWAGQGKGLAGGESGRQGLFVEHATLNMQH